VSTAAQNELVTRSCPACQAMDGRTRGQKNDFTMLECRSCGTIYTQNLPPLIAAEDYDAYYTLENLSVPQFIDRRLDEIVAAFSRYRATNRLLDIGCGAGSLLQAAARAGWSAEGVEVSRPAVEHVRAAGFKAFCGELAEARFPDGHFDVVTASELLEHLPHPGSLIREIARILRPGGLCWATTPHSRGASGHLLKLDWSVVSPPEHLHIFSAAGLEGLFVREGFRNVRIKTEGVNPIELSRFARRRKNPCGDCPEADGFDRVRTSYQLNEALVSSAPRRALKNFLNAFLRVTRLGDSLKVWAER
jgi:SAM-dependent methyltransferase